VDARLATAAVVLSPMRTAKRDREAQLEEAVGLARAIDLDVAGQPCCCAA
jgi:hypothetical protein